MTEKEIELETLITDASLKEKNLPKQRSRNIKHKVIVDSRDNSCGISESRRKGFGQRIFLWLSINWKRATIYSLVVFVILPFSFILWKDIRDDSSVRLHGDYSDVQGIEDLEKRKELIDDWCYPGMKKRCSCENPMVGSPRHGQRHWLTASHANSDLATSAVGMVDVVFFGDSITEGWRGTSYGFPVGRKERNFSVFKSLFTVSEGGEYDGIALGISGDTSPNLLWRLQNGELPDSLNPSVIWLLIGTNDFGNTWCPPDVVLIGILRVVEEIKARKPGSTIVINSLLPRTYDKRNGYVMRKRRFGPKSSKNPPSLWKPIEEINRQLHAYSKKNDRVEFFDASNIFLKDTSVHEDKLQIDKNLMGDLLHPNYLGYQLWGVQITKKLEELVPKN